LRHPGIFCPQQNHNFMAAMIVNDARDRQSWPIKVAVRRPARVQAGDQQHHIAVNTKANLTCRVSQQRSMATAPLLR